MLQVETTQILTFLRHSNQQRPAVFSLEFIEIGADLQLVLGSSEQVGQDGAALGGRVDILQEPVAPAGPVEQTVPLDELGLTVDLEIVQDGAGEKFEPSVRLLHFP